MKRVTKRQAEIIKAHLDAKVSGKWNSREIKTAEDFKAAMEAGETNQAIFEELEIRCCSITSIILASSKLNMRYLSNAYKAEITKGFKKLLTTVGIV